MGVELGAPRLERGIERGGGVAAAAAQTGGNGDPLVEPRGEGRRSARGRPGRPAAR